MTIPRKTLSNGYSLPVLGLGTWQMGDDPDRDVAAIRAAIEAGLTHLDTAEVYGDGQAETLIAQAIEGLDRSSLQIVSKVSPRHFAAADLRRSLESSLDRLKTDYLDTYLLHRPNDDIPLEETLGAMDHAVDEGLVKHVGVSNFNISQLQAAQALSKHPIVQNQVHYNLRFREPEHRGLIEYCAANDVLFEAWSPLKKLWSAEPPAIVTELGEKYGKAPFQLALNWLISQPAVVTIVKTSSSEHLQENLGAIGWELDAADIERLRAEFPDQQDVSDLVPLDDEETAA